MNRGIDPRVVRGISSLRDDLVRAAGQSVVAIYVHGSAVLGDFVPGSSDLDVLVVADDDIDGERIADLASVLTAHDATPACGIEASVVTRSAARRPRAPWPFLVHVTTAPADRKIVDGTSVDGDPDLILHYAVLRHHGWTADGSPAAETIGEIDTATITAQLADELRWAADHAPPSYAVLNTCRALRFAREGVLCSKSGGGMWALSQQIEPDLVTAAMATRQKGAAEVESIAMRHWVRSVAWSLADARERGDSATRTS